MFKLILYKFNGWVGDNPWLQVDVKNILLNNLSSQNLVKREVQDEHWHDTGLFVSTFTDILLNNLKSYRPKIFTITLLRFYLTFLTKLPYYVILSWSKMSFINNK